MKPISRRHFIQVGLIGVAAITAGFPNSVYANYVIALYDQCELAGGQETIH